MKGFNPFGSIPVPKKGRTNFNLSHSLAGTFALSDLQPVFFTDTIPGDSFRINVHNLTKLETLIAPAMQQIDASLLWFKIPKRLCFNKFKDWYSGGTDGETDAVKPHWDLRAILSELNDILSVCSTAQAKELKTRVFGPGSLWHYLGLPNPIEYNSSTGVWDYTNNSFEVDNFSDDDAFIDAMPFIAYWLLHDEYFMDQTLGQRMFVSENDLAMNGRLKWVFRINQDTKYEYVATDSVGDGGDLSIASFFVMNQLFKRAWRKEYFTSALPTPQRGPEVKINMFDGQTLDVEQDSEIYLKKATGDTPLDSYLIQVAGSNDAPEIAGMVSAEASSSPLDFNLTDRSGAEKTNLSVDMSGLSPMLITAFRNLFKLQEFLEKNNVAGGRFIETILAHWAERVPDFTVQRPVHVRSTSIPVQISEVTAQAYSSGVQSQLGDQAGRAKGMGNLGSVRIYTQEPCFIFGLYCVTTPPDYVVQGIPRLFQHQTRFDEPWRDFQHIGEQAIKNRELWVDWYNADQDYNHADFGYQQRYSEYKYMPNRVVGDFATSLAYWHMARMFAEQPYLNEDFVTCKPDERIFAVKAARPVTASFYFDIKASRKLSKYSTPKLT